MQLKSGGRRVETFKCAATASVLPGSGEALFEGIDLVALRYRCTEHAASEKATHVVLSRSAEIRRTSMHLNHTIIHARDKQASATFLSELLGLPPPRDAGPFAMVQVDADLSLDFIDAEDTIGSQHYAFLVTEAEFDAIFARVQQRGLSYWADPFRQEPGRINTWDDGRGVYFDDPNGHLLELITRPYGSGGTTTQSPHPLFKSAAT